jgi:hypothetical protein
MALPARTLKVGDTHEERIVENLTRTRCNMQASEITTLFIPMRSSPQSCGIIGFLPTACSRWA